MREWAGVPGIRDENPTFFTTGQDNPLHLDFSLETTTFNIDGPAMGSSNEDPLTWSVYSNCFILNDSDSESSPYVEFSSSPPAPTLDLGEDICSLTDNSRVYPNRSSMEILCQSLPLCSTESKVPFSQSNFIAPDGFPCSSLESTNFACVSGEDEDTRLANPQEKTGGLGSTNPPLNHPRHVEGWQEPCFENLTFPAIELADTSKPSTIAAAQVRETAL